MNGLRRCDDCICCCCSGTKLCLTLCNPVNCSKPGSTISWRLLKLMSIELVVLLSHLILCCPLLLLPLIFPSIKVFSSESALHIRWWKYWSFSISLSNKYAGLTSFRIDFLKETLKVYIYDILRFIFMIYDVYI